MGGLCYLMLINVIFPFILINESRLAIRSKLLVTVAKMKEFLSSCLRSKTVHLGIFS